MFKMSEKITEYFRPLRNRRITTMDFDAYYYCAVVGMAKGKRLDAKSDREIIRDVPIKYSQDGKYKEMLLTMINAEVRRTGSDLNNRNDIKILCNSLLDTDSISSLTIIGFETLNSYCLGGYYELKKENVNMSEPRVFFEEYISLIDDL